MNQLLSVSIKLIAESNCSERDLKKHLEKEFAELPDLDKRITETIARLRELHLINDSRLAESIALRYSHKGNRFITQTLKQKGVMDEVITHVLSSLDDECSRALDEARKRGSHKTSKNLEEIKTNLARFLSGRGFSHDSINSVMNALGEEGFFQSSETNQSHNELV